MPFFWVTGCSQAPQRSPDILSEQPAQRTGPRSHECSAVELGEEEGRDSSQITVPPAQTLRAQLGLAAPLGPWPVEKEVLAEEVLLAGHIHRQWWPWDPQTNIFVADRQRDSETGAGKPSTGAGNPAGSMKPSFMGHQPKAPEQTLPAALPSPSEKPKCFKGDSAPLTDLLHPPILPTNSARLALSP